MIEWYIIKTHIIPKFTQMYTYKTDSTDGHSHHHLFNETKRLKSIFNSFILVPTANPN